MPMCLIVGCGNKTGKSAKTNDSDGEKLKFFKVPKIVTIQGEMMETLTTERRQAWISAISRDDLTEEKLENDKVCGSHFVSGKSSKVWERYEVDWIPTLHVGHTKKHNKLKDPQLNEARADRRKRRQKTVENEVLEKIKKLNEPGETVENIFTSNEFDGPQEDTCSQHGDQDTDLEMETDYFVDEQTSSKTFVEAETQTCLENHTESESMDAETQTVEFQYMFSTTKIQPFTELFGLRL